MDKKIDNKDNKPRGGDVRQYSIEDAKKYGINAAVILWNIDYWVEKNRANRINFHDGCYWTFNSCRALSELFSPMSPKTIRGALNKLEKMGAIRSANFNKMKYDRTKWYTIGGEKTVPDESKTPSKTPVGSIKLNDPENMGERNILQNEQMLEENIGPKGQMWEENIGPLGHMDVPSGAHSCALEGQPIPDIKHRYENTAEKHLCASKEILEQTPVEKVFLVYQKKVHPTGRLLPASRDKINTRLKTYSVEELLQAIDNFSNSPWWMKHNAARGATWFFYNDQRIEQFLGLKDMKEEKKSAFHQDNVKLDYKGLDIFKK